MIQSDWLYLEDYQNVMDINVYGTIDMTRTFLPIVRKEKGRIVIMSSVAGRCGMGGSAYVTSKHALEGYTKSLR